MLGSDGQDEVLGEMSDGAITPDASHWTSTFRIRYNQDKTHRYITSTCEVGDAFKNNRDVGRREEKDEEELEAGATISQSEV